MEEEGGHINAQESRMMMVKENKPTTQEEEDRGTIQSSKTLNRSKHRKEDKEKERRTIIEKLQEEGESMRTPCMCTFQKFPLKQPMKQRSEYTQRESERTCKRIHILRERKRNKRGFRV
jgi:hypothetical protein